MERGNLEIRHVILGSSDLDQSPNFQAHLKTSAVVNLMFPVLKTGKLPDILSKMVLKKYGEENLKLLSAMFATISTGMGNVTKTSVKNQFYSDLITPLADQISLKILSFMYFMRRKWAKNMKNAIYSILQTLILSGKITDMRNYYSFTLKNGFQKFCGAVERIDAFFHMLSTD